jgi:phosphomethylpyrimidine synthase
MCGPKFCSMRITQDVREYAARHGMGEEEAVAAGLEEKAREFARRGAELYVAAEGAADAVAGATR